MPRHSIMLPYKLEGRTIVYPVLVQPKLDGLRARYVPGLPKLLSSQGNELPNTAEVASGIAKSKLGGYELDGELYSHDLTFQQISSLVRRANHPDAGQVKYHVFDLIIEDMRQVHRSNLLHNLFKNTVPASVVEVPTLLVLNKEEFEQKLNLFIELGYEGIIVRDPHAFYERKRSTGLLKYKPRKELIAEVVGQLEEVSIDGVYKGSLGALVCKLQDGTTFSVGTGFTRSQREEFWRNSLKGAQVRVLYQELTEAGVPRFPVFKEVLKRDNSPKCGC